jgi:hypothetical protein
MQVTSRRWLGSEINAQERLRRLYALFTTRILKEACSKASPQIIEGCRDSGEVYLEVSFRGHEVWAGVS